MSSEKGEKDRFGDKLRDLEHAREEDYFIRRERELIAKLRASMASESTAEAEPCPVCKAALVLTTEDGLAAKLCPVGHGAWFPPAALEALVRLSEPRAAERLLGRLAQR
jgi:hypothetical protein